LGKDTIQGCRRNEMKPTIPKTKTPKSYEIGVFYGRVARFCSLLYFFCG